MKFYKRSRIMIIFAIVAIGLAVYVGLRSMKKEGMTPPPQITEVTYLYADANGNEMIGKMTARPQTFPVIWDEVHPDGQTWIWEQQGQQKTGELIYFISTNYEPPQQLYLNIENKNLIWQPDPTSEDSLTYIITGVK